MEKRPPGRCGSTVGPVSPLKSAQSKLASILSTISSTETFSRNIHNTDYMEHLAERGAIGKEQWQRYQDVRDRTALSTAIACTWRTASFVDWMLERTYFEQLARYWLRCLSFKHWV